MGWKVELCRIGTLADLSGITVEEGQEVRMEGEDTAVVAVETAEDARGRVVRLVGVGPDPDRDREGDMARTRPRFRVMFHLEWSLCMSL